MTRATFTPAIAYRDPKAALDWLGRAFGFELALLITDSDGKLGHSGMNLHDGYIYVSSEWSADVRSPLSVDGANTQCVHVQLSADIDEHYQQAQRAGARVLRPIADEPYGDRVYGVTDLEGHLWTFGQTMHTVPRAELEQVGGMRIEGPEVPRATFGSAVIYQDFHAALAWLQRAFGFDLNLLVTQDDGSVAHCELSYGNGYVMPTIAFHQAARSPQQVSGANTQSIHVHLAQNVDAHCAMARAAGAHILQEPEDQFYGDRVYRARDPEGHVWTFGQTVRQVTPEEAAAATGLTIEGRW